VVGYLPAATVLLFGLVAITACVRQRDPRVPFIAILALVVLVIVATFGMIAGFGER
jgi:heme A synthase